MGACSIERTNALTVIRFTAFADAPGIVWPAAIVVWRGPMRTGYRSLRGWLRSLRYGVGFDPLHAPFTIGSDAGLWMGNAGPHGERETLFHARRHVVRVAGREFTIPGPGKTLVLLVDDADGRDERVLSRVIDGATERMDEGVAIAQRIAIGRVDDPANPFVDPADPMVMLMRSDAEVRAFFAPS